MIPEGGPTPGDRIAWAFRRATAGRPTPTSCNPAARASPARLAKYQGRYPAAAEKLIAVGETQADPNLDPAELAAYTHDRQHHPEPRRSDHARLTKHVAEPASRAARIQGAIVMFNNAPVPRRRRQPPDFPHAPPPASASRRWPLCSTVARTRGVAAARVRFERSAHLRTSPPRPSASSTCSSPAPRRRSTCSTTSRSSHEPARHGAARLDPHGPAAHRHDLRPEDAFPSRPPIFQFAQHGQSGAWVSELLPHTAERRRRALLHQVDAHRGDQPRPGDHLLPDRRRSSPAGRASAPGSSYGLGSENQRPARVRRADLAGHRQPDDQPLYDRLWGSGFLPTQLPGRQVPLRRRPGALPVQPARRRRRDAPRACSTTSAALNQLHARRASATRRSPPASRSTRWPSGCRRRVPELTDLSNEPQRRPRAVRPRRRASRARFAANCLLARRLVERGVRFIQLFHRGWDQHGNLPKQIRRPVPRHRPALRRPDHGPEAARPARRHAGRLGRRVRPHRLLPGRR